jgi:cytochrome c553
MIRKPMPPLARLAVAALAPWALHAPAAAADAERGARLYLGLPGGQASCVECHGPDPGLDRNRLLNAARGPFAIDEALRKAAAMGYLAELLSPADRADLSAYLALVASEAEGSSAALAWPWGLEFGRVAPGGALAPQPVRLRNRGSGPLALAPGLRELAPGGAAGLTLAHDCPELLPPGADCTVQLGLVAAGPGAVNAALTWGGAAGALRPVGLSATVGQAPAGNARWLDAPTERVVALQAAPGGEASVLLSMHNAGAAPLVLGVPAITGPGRGAFRLLPGPDAGACVANAVLPPQGRCTVRVVATAGATGLLEATLQWRNDGQHAPPRLMQVQAVGAAPPPPIAAPPAASPAPAPGPSPAPVPAPVPAAADAGGGCRRSAWPQGRTDPLLPGLVLLAAMLLAARRRGRLNQPASSA